MSFLKNIKRVRTKMAFKAGFGIFGLGALLIAFQNFSSVSGSLQGSVGTILSRADGQYSYAPSIMYDGGIYKMWFCGRSDDRSDDGDHIMYAEASSPNGPWHAHGNSIANSYDDVFKHPSRNRNGFDGDNTCDPSVIKVNNMYYMYYGGEDIGHYNTMIGAAWSTDGIHWARWDNSDNSDSPGKPIISPYRPNVTTPGAADNGGRSYGAGQPSVAFDGTYYYLIYTDTTGTASDGNGGGQYVLRSQDWTFGHDPQRLPVFALTKTGVWAPFNSSTQTSYSLFAAFSVDMQFDSVNKRFIIASAAGTRGSPNYGYFLVQFFSQNFQKLYNQDVYIPAPWMEGPGLISNYNKTVMFTDGTNLKYSFNVIYPMKNPYSAYGNPFSWVLSWVRLNVYTR